MTLRICQPAGLMLLAILTCIPAQTVAQTTANQDAGDGLLYRAALAAAEKSLRLHETGDAMQWLDAAPENLRGWEWNHLHAMGDECLRKNSMTGEGWTALDVSPDGSRLAVAEAGGTVTLYSLPDGNVERTIGDHDQAVYKIAFSPDGRRLATVSRDVTSRVWDIATGKQISRMKMDNPGVAAVTFSPDGNRVATCSWLMLEPGKGDSVRGTVWVWNAETGEVEHKKYAGVKPLDSIAWSADGATIAVGSWDGEVYLLDQEATLVKTLTIPREGVYTAVISVAISPDGSRVAAGAKDRTARIWNTAEGTLIGTCSGHAGFVTGLCFSQDGKQLLSGSVDGTVRTWDAENGAPQNVMRGHTRGLVAVDLGPSGNELISISRDGTMRSWDIHADYGARVVRRVAEGGTYTTTFSPDGNVLYCAMHEGNVLALDARSGETIAQWEAHPGSTCNTLALTADGKRLLTCSWDKNAHLWDTETHSRLATLDAGAGVYSCAISADGGLAALCCGKKLQIWDVGQTKKLAACPTDQSFSCAIFLPDGKTIASADGSSIIKFWNAESGENVAQLEKDGVNFRELAVYGNLLASAAVGEVVFWDTQSHQQVGRCRVGDRTVYRLSFTADGKRLAVGTDAVVIVDPNRDEPLIRLLAQDDDVYFLAFSPDGMRLASCTTGGQVVVCESKPLGVRESENPATAAK